MIQYIPYIHDGGRDGLFGPGEAIPGRRMPRCGLCRKFFPVWEYTEAGADDPRIGEAQEALEEYVRAKKGAVK